MFTRWYRRFLWLWRWVTQPLEQIGDREAQARRLASVVAWSILATLIVIFMRLFIMVEIVFEVWPLLLTIAALACVFGLVLRRQVQLARWGYVLTMHATIYAMWALHVTEPAVLTLGYLPLLTLIVGELLSLRSGVLTVIVNQLIVFFLYLLIPQAPYLGVTLFMNASLGSAICIITYARLRERRQLIESEQRYRALMEINFEPVAIVGLDRAIVNVNPAFEALAGLPAAQLVGQPIETFISADSKALFEQIWGKREGRLVRLKARSAHGDEFMVEVRTTQELYNRKRALVMTVRDLSRETEFERKRREYELRYQAIFEHSYDGIFIVDLDGTCLSANQRGLEMLGLTAEEYARCKASDFVYPDEVENSLQVIEQLKRGETVRGYSRRLVRRDGQVLFVEITPTLVRDALGNPLHLQSIVRDVSERVHSEEERIALTVQSERARVLHQLINDLNHHVRTPLSNIKNSAYLMKRLDNAESRERHQVIIDSEVDRLITLLNELITLARLETEADQQSITAIDLNQLVKDLMPYPTGLAPQDTDHPWHVELASQPPVVFGSFTRLRDAMQRLVENARSYTPAGGNILIQVREHEQFKAACVRISDSGIGIAPDDLDHIFEAFHRSDAARASKPFSTGLGLSIARKVIELHGGHITVQSALNVGTTFTVWLPTDLQSKLSHETLELIKQNPLPSQDI